MKKIVFAFLSVATLLIASCTSTGFFSNKSPREQYADKLEKAGLNQSALGIKWLEQGRNTFETAIAVSIPYREVGYFAADVPRSAGFRLRPKRGQRLEISIAIKPERGAVLFVELWENSGNVNKFKLVMAADSSLQINYEVEDNPELLLTIQPELLVAVSYTLTITAEPSLAFPVPGNNGKKVGSFWGENRDGGSRKHEGIDIFDKFRSPLIAAEDGMITRAGENGLGGKVIWLSPSGKNYNLYYAHLDEQLVSSMQRVKKGDTIGLMGNTGNAKNTPSHLHFGIYAKGGAIDPLPFVQQVSKETEPIKGVLLNINARTNKKIALQNTPNKKSVTITTLAVHSFIKIEAAMGQYYKVFLPDGTNGFIPISAIEAFEKPVKSYSLKASSELFFLPDSGSAVIKQIDASIPVKIFAVSNQFAFVQVDNTNGWIYFTE